MQRVGLKEGKTNGVKPHGTRKPSFLNESSVCIADESHAHMVLPESASRATAAAGTITSVKHSFIDLHTPTSNSPLPALTVKDVADSLILAGQVGGAIHITGAENTVIAVTCRQFRMHQCKKVDVYLNCTSRPIIEDCEEIRFAPLPEVLVST